MPTINVNTGLLQTNGERLRSIENSLNGICTSLSEFDLMSINIGAKDNLMFSIKACENTLNSNSRSLHNMIMSLTSIIEMYQKIEQELGTLFNNNSSKGQTGIQRGGPYEIDSIVFPDEDGRYGGDQGRMDQTYKWNPFKCWELLYQLKGYDSGINLFEAFGYFSKINSVGCGYVAMCNTIFMEYEGREAEFERTFGFSYYDSDGNVNSDRLLLDMYMTTYKDGLNDSSDADDLPDGTTPESRQQIMENYLAHHGQEVETELYVDINEDNFREFAESGKPVIIRIQGVDLQDENGRVYHTVGEDSGHAMTVTGFSEDGRIIVSSWGKKLYIDPAQLDENDNFMIFNIK